MIKFGTAIARRVVLTTNGGPKLSMRTQSQEAVIENLRSGNKRFVEGKSRLSIDTSLAKLKDYAQRGQSPKAIILCCSDSRAPVEMIFDQDLGDLFVIRVAGNIVAPSLVGSVEYAASQFGISVVLVMGHSGCGAVAATLDFIESPGSIASENLHDIIGRIKPNIFAISQTSKTSRAQKLKAAVEANVYASVHQLMRSSRLIERLVAEEKISIVPAVLDLDTAEVTWLDA